MKKRTIISVQGECPQCGGKDLIYGGSSFEDDQVYFDFICGDRLCGYEGKEWYRLDYIESV